MEYDAVKSGSSLPKFWRWAYGSILTLQLFVKYLCLATRMWGVTSENTLVLNVTAVRTSEFVSKFSFPHFFIRYLQLLKSKIRRRIFRHTWLFALKIRGKLKKTGCITRRKSDTLSLRNQQCYQLWEWRSDVGHLLPHKYQTPHCNTCKIWSRLWWRAV